MKNVLEVVGLNKSYKSFSLTDISFAVPEGCITGFIGVNGAGKATTIRAILGLVGRASGDIKVFGKDMGKNAGELKNRLGVVLDEGYFYDGLTMEEMKSIIAPAYTGWREKEYKNYMELFSLKPSQKIGTLSRGMRIKFALSLALSHQADLLIMDEPTSGLDPLIRSQFLEIIKDYMKQGGKSVLFSTHITSDLDKAADMLILIHDGRIIFEMDKDTLLDGHRLVKGDKNILNEENRGLFLNIQEREYGFTGITDKMPGVQKNIPGCLFERPGVEDIMLAYIEGGNDNVGSFD